MKYLKFLLFLLFLLFPFSFAHAFEFQTGSDSSANYILAADQTVDDNLIVLANQVEILGKVNGDLIVLAQTAKISGEVSGNIAVAAVDIIFKGKTLKDALFLAGAVDFVSGSEVRQDLTVLASNSINREAVKVGRKSWLSQTESKKPVFSAQTAILKVLFGTVVLSILAALLLWLSPKPLHQVTQTIKSEPIKLSLIGIVALLGGPIVVVLLLLTIVGWASAAILAAILWIIATLSPIFIGFILGEFLLKAKYPAIICVILGVIIYQIIILIPYLGPILALLTVMVGMGAGLTTVYRMGKQ